MKHRNFLALVLALLVASTAQAQTKTATVVGNPQPDTTPNLYRSTTNIGSNLPSWLACLEAARADAMKRPDGLYTYGCDPGRTSFSVRVVTETTPPPPTCPPAPAPQTRQQVCPQGTTGTFTQISSSTVGPAPLCTVTTTWSPSTPPAGSCPAEPPPPPSGTAALHFSDCQAGAASSCVLGNNANPGTPASPKRDLIGININALPAGTQLLFARGGAWALRQTGVQNPNSTAANPLLFGDYGSGPKPLFNVNGGIGFQLGGNWGNTDNDGGYVFRNLRLVGTAPAGSNTHWGFWLVQNVRDVVFDGVELERFGTAIETNEGNPHGVTGMVLRNSVIRGNWSMGIHSTGLIHRALVENNLFEGNNASGSFMNHAIYWGGGNGSVIRGNRFLRNSEVSGVCQGGNVTMHGVIDGLLIENNTLEHETRSADTCGGFNITAGYSSPEAFRNVVVRGNTIVNAGIGAVIANSAPGIIIEGNRSINQFGRGHTLALTYGENEVAMTNPVVRNNRLCGIGSITNLPGAAGGGNVVSALTDPACQR